VRISVIALLCTLGTSIIAGVAGGNRPARVDFRPATAGCGVTTANDSAAFLEALQFVVSSPIAALRTSNGLPQLPADSVRYGGTGAQCDSVRARYNALRTSETGVAWTSSPVLMLRVGPTRWVADPKVVDQYGQREWIILDSLFTIQTIWRTQGHG